MATVFEPIRPGAADDDDLHGLPSLVDDWCRRMRTMANQRRRLSQVRMQM
jgi:hypothetical protein